MTTQMIDFAMTNQGSVYLIRPMTDAAKTHADEVYADALRFGGAIAVDHNFAASNAENLLNDGFTVSLDGQELALRE